MFKNIKLPNWIKRFKNKSNKNSLHDPDSTYCNLVEQALVGIYIIQDMRVRYVNRTWCEIHGYTSKEVIDNFDFLDLVYSNDRPLVKQNIEKRLSGQHQSLEYQYRGLRKDGSTIWVKVLGRTMTYKGKPAITGTLIDITAYKLVEENLLRSESRLRTLIDTIPDLIWLKNTEGVYLQCNRQFELFFGASEKDIVGKTDYDFVDKELADFFRQKDLDAISAEKPSVNEEEITYPDGRKEILETIKTPIFESNGTLIGVLGIGRNISERKQAETELKDSEEFMKILLKLTPYPISLTNSKNQFILVNDAFYRINNVEGQEVIGKTPQDFGFTPETATHEFIKHEMKTNGKIDNINLVTTVGGGKITETLYSSLVVRWKNTPLILHSSIDITEMKQAQRELEKYRQHLELLVLERTEELEASIEELNAVNEELFNQKEELQHTIDTLNSARKQLIQSEKMASLGILSAGIAHEINNPLNFIHGGNLALRNYFDDNLPEYKTEVAPFLEAITEGVSRAAQIVTSLSHYSRRDDLPMVSCNMHSIIDNCLVMLQNQLKGKITIYKHYTQHTHTLTGNEGKLHQAILNIIANAEQAIETEGTINIETEVNNNLFCIEISDTGSGIDAQTIDKIFDPFFTTKVPGKGTGLGLAITFNIIQEHKGNIEYQSEPGKGTKAKISLPFHQ